MAGTVKIQIQGFVKASGDQQVLINVLRPRVERFAKDYNISLFGFLRTSYRIEIVGTPSNFEYIDNLIAAINLHVKKYMKKWSYNIKVNYLERE